MMSKSETSLLSDIRAFILLKKIPMETKSKHNMFFFETTKSLSDRSPVESAKQIHGFFETFNPSGAFLALFPCTSQ